MKKLIAEMDKPLLILSIITVIYGLLMVFSSSSIIGIQEQQNPLHFFLRQATFVAASMFISFIIINIPTSKYQKPALIILGLIILSLLGLNIWGETTRASKRWFNLGLFSIQPSEFSKMAIIVVMATYYEKIVLRNKNIFKKIAFPLILGFITILLIAIQPDFGTSIILIGIVLLTFLSIPLETKAKKTFIKIIAFTISIITAATFFFLMVTDFNITTKIERFDFLDPCSKNLDVGYQVCNGYVAMNNGGLSGVGLGNSTQKYLYLPEAHTDFIFPIIVEELGLLGGVFTLILLFGILSRVILISKKSSSLRGSILAHGIAVYFFLHLALNLGGVLGLLPLTGLTLPFFSYGGSSMLTSIIALTIVQRVKIETSQKERQNYLSKSLN